MMNADFIACLPRIMVADGDNRREKHVITRRHALQAVVRLFIRVKESRLKSGQLEISGSAQDGAGVSKRTCQMIRAKVCLRECFGMLIGALGKMEHRQLGPLFKQPDDACYTI